MQAGDTALPEDYHSADVSASRPLTYSTFNCILLEPCQGGDDLGGLPAEGGVPRFLLAFLWRVWGLGMARCRADWGEG